jgi:hypothetical protein
MAAIFAAGNAAKASDSDEGGKSHPGWTMVNAGEGRKVPVRTYENWSRAYARAQDRGDGVVLVDAAASLLTLGVLGADPYGYGYGYPGYAYGCVRTYWDPGMGYVRVRAPC